LTANCKGEQNIRCIHGDGTRVEFDIGSERVTRLYRRDDLPEERCWLRAPGWCLTCD